VGDQIVRKNYRILTIMPERAYIETTVVSYLTARPSRDVVIAGHQQTTHEWWDTRRHEYDLCASELVWQEAAAGDPQAAQERLEILKTILLLGTTPEALALAKSLIRAGALPAQAADDALHIAIAATNGVPFLVTWNCRHLANAVMRPVIESVCASVGLKTPIICTSEELLGEQP
jgi:predicted nucleic acid-binding protein